MATTIRLFRRTVGKEVRIVLLEFTRHEKLQPLALYQLKTEPEVRDYVAQMHAALDLPILNADEYRFADPTDVNDP